MLTFLLGCAVGGAVVVFKNRIVRIKNKIGAAIDEEMSRKP